MTSEAITIRVYGQNTLLPVPTTAIGNLKQSWLDFLNRDCEIGVGPEDGFMITTYIYSAKSGRMTKNLREPIHLFTDRFTLKRPVYCVRLRQFTVPVSATTTPQPTASTHDSFYSSSYYTRSAQKRKRDSGSRAPPRSHLSTGSIPSSRPPSESTKRIILPINKRSRPSEDPFLPQLRFEGNVLTPIISNVTGGGGTNFRNLFRDVDIETVASGSGRVENVDIQVVEDDDDDEDDDDVMSLRTCARDEHIELHKSGILPENILQDARMSFEKLDNNFLLRVRKEIRNLKKKDMWTRNFQRAPLGCLLLEMVLERRQ